MGERGSSKPSSEDSHNLEFRQKRQKRRLSWAAGKVKSKQGENDLLLTQRPSEVSRLKHLTVWMKQTVWNASGS